MAVGKFDTIIFSTALTSNTATAKEEVGILRYEIDKTYGLKVYMYVLASGTISKGNIVSWGGVTGYTVKKETTSTAGQQQPVGVAIGTITDTYYGWIQVKGHNEYIMTHSKYNTTAYQYGFVLSGTFRGKPDGNSYEYGTALSVHVDRCREIIPLESVGSLCVSCCGYINCM